MAALQPQSLEEWYGDRELFTGSNKGTAAAELTQIHDRVLNTQVAFYPRLIRRKHQRSAVTVPMQSLAKYTTERPIDAGCRK